MSKPLVSVIMLTYNHSAFLSDAIENICTQKTSFDFEVLVGDDASTDSTQQILKTFETKYSNLLDLNSSNNPSDTIQLIDQLTMGFNLNLIVKIQQVKLMSGMYT